MPDNERPVRSKGGRWPTFSLRALLVGVTLLGVGLAWLGWQAKIVHDRRVMLDWIYANGGWAAGTHGHCKMSQVRRWLGDESQDLMFHLPDNTDERRREEFRRLFPEAMMQSVEDSPAARAESL